MESKNGHKVDTHYRFEQLYTWFHAKMLTSCFFTHQRMIKLTVDKQDQPTSKRQIGKSMDFFHAF
jgi:hypothetical protein